jgi:hypothetical protein
MAYPKEDLTADLKELLSFHLELYGYDGFVAMPGEMCTISPTPKYPGPAIVILSQIENLDDNKERECLRMWFKRSIIPLVGEAAAEDLDKLLQKGGNNFLNKVARYKRRKK